jgi:hypothetical protein
MSTQKNDANVVSSGPKNMSIRATENNELLKELLTRQLKTVPYQKKLQYSDLKRICKYITTSIFDLIKCSKWIGYITNGHCENHKGTYINFYFRKKKAALHRLLYSNFIGDLSDDEYLKFGCENKGTCCNIHHFKKFKYSSKTIVSTDAANDSSNLDKPNTDTNLPNTKPVTRRRRTTKVEVGKVVQIFNKESGRIIISFD